MTMNEDRIPDGDDINEKGMTMREGRDIWLEENFIVRVARGRGRVIYKNCWWNVRELIVYYLDFIKSS